MEVGDGRRHYDGVRPDFHPHVVCTRCGRIADVEIGGLSGSASAGGGRRRDTHSCPAGRVLRPLPGRAEEQKDRRFSVSVTQDTKAPDAANRRLIKAIESNWQAEMEGAATYQALADRETDPRRKHTLEGLAKAETAHARLWERRLAELGAAAAQIHGPATGQADTLPNRIGGTDAALRRIEMDERKHVAHYGRQLTGTGRRAERRDPAQSHRRRAGAFQSAQAHAGPGARPSRRPWMRPSARTFPARWTRSRRWTNCGRARAIGPRHPGSGTPFTASTTAWARSSASFPACPARP